MAAQQAQRTLTYQEWNESLLDVLLPELAPERTGSPVLLACDEDSVIAAGTSYAVPPTEAATGFGRAVELRYALAATGSTDRVRRDTVSFNNSADRASSVPPFLGVCAVMVLAAFRMTTDTDVSALNYYKRLWATLGSEPHRRPPYEFDYAPWLFKYLAQWLERDLSGRRGLLVLSDDGPAYVGCAINQCLFRQRDKEHLTEFFAHRVKGDAEHLDLLRLLQVSSDRHYLTHRAQAVIADPRLQPMARAAVEQVWRDWDGTVPDSHGGRSWPGVLHLSVNRRLQLTISAPNAPSELEFYDGDAGEGRLALALDALSALGDRGIRLGKQGQPGVYLPAAGDTLVFEVREDTGLVWVKAASQPTAYVLSRSSELKRRLADYLFTGRHAGSLPSQWQLFERVPAERLPDELGSGAAASTRPAVALVGGLRIARGWLAGFPPRLEVGAVDEALTVVVNGHHVGDVHAGGQLAPDLGEGDHVVDVGDGLASFNIHMFACNPARPRYGHLGCSLDAGGARTGASPRPRAPSICGALPDEPYQGRLPLLFRARSPLLITADGVGLRQEPPPVPRWLKAVGLDPKVARWEVELDDNIVWAVAGRTAIMVSRVVPASLDRAAAAAVRSLGDSPWLRCLSPEDQAAARDALDALRQLAMDEREPA